MERAKRWPATKSSCWKLPGAAPTTSPRFTGKSSPARLSPPAPSCSSSSKRSSKGCGRAFSSSSWNVWPVAIPSTKGLWPRRSNIPALKSLPPSRSTTRTTSTTRSISSSAFSCPAGSIKQSTAACSGAALPLPKRGNGCPAWPPMATNVSGFPTTKVGRCARWRPRPILSALSSGSIHPARRTAAP